MDRVGPFRTAGWGVDTWGVAHGIVDEGAFLDELEHAREESRLLLREALAGHDRLLVHFFEFTDRAGHILYRFLDQEHPRHEAEAPQGLRTALLDAYRAMDSVVGEVRERLGPADTLLVLSGYGMSSWRRTFDLGAWLADNGYLGLEGEDLSRSPRVDQLGEDFWRGVDWGRTTAYGLGVGGLYVNLKGREGRGIVEPGSECDALRQELKQRLEGVVDPATGRYPIHAVYLREEVFERCDEARAPDLIVTTSPGYRLSWQSALSGVSGEVLTPNLGAWSGDHCSLDPSAVPGILFANTAVDRQRVQMIDVYPTVLDLLGLEAPERVDGKPFLSREGIR
jgi:predicted AlkP superfamily phosphohydrolase/phosphomutase